MNPDQPDGQESDPDKTIRHRLPHPGQPPRSSPPQQGPPEVPSTQRLPYTPDMLPDVSHYETKPPKSAWRWVVVVGGLVLLIAILAVAVLLWVRSTAGAAPSSTPGEPAGVTLV